MIVLCITPSSLVSTLLLALGLARRLTPRALEAVLGDVNADETAMASPPGGRDIAALEPVLVDGISALLDVLAVELTQVVAEVIAAVERLAGAGAPRVVAAVAVLERYRRVRVPVVPLEIGATPERACIAAGREAEDGPVADGSAGFVLGSDGVVYVGRGSGEILVLLVGGISHGRVVEGVQTQGRVGNRGCLRASRRAGVSGERYGLVIVERICRWRPIVLR